MIANHSECGMRPNVCWRSSTINNTSSMSSSCKIEERQVSLAMEEHQERCRESAIDNGRTSTCNRPVAGRDFAIHRL
jgi:hypothetical protein